ncbi:D-glycero-beta-D-manno-heptose-7-phosphate kinase [Parvibium lacunae]|uniref:D-glycero-beta-D-manno-heptose-7-phosphate kinase n=1 Tax=Parvibium lacunae TaxID=1888893 RepID=A0A368L4Z8_9BURK|nr:D-glycero-beta-D-manno-heptose-7-phosphate kinase [Parvibium lacunae]RCS58502.1 D-glycero-beta-D-manno-heptose-7-phosphate kinase [Parvibium lacunae]
MNKPELAQARVLVVGDIMLDRYWFGDVDRISPEAPVPVVRVRRTEDRLGGAANVARNAAALSHAVGGQTALMGVVGQDEAAQRIQQLLSESGVQAYLQQDAELPTTIKQRVLGRQQQLLRIDFEESPSRDILLDKLTEFEKLLPHYDVVVLSDYGKGGLQHIARMITLARAANKIVLVDPKGDDYQRYRGATLLTPNRAELKQVVGTWKTEAELYAKASQLRQELTLDALLVTRSEEGMTLLSEAGVVHVPAQAREVFDVSGAGDTVIATLAVMLGSQVSLVESVHWANKAGGIVVGKLGTAVIQPDELFALA